MPAWTWDTVHVPLVRYWSCNYSNPDQRTVKKLVPPFFSCQSLYLTDSVFFVQASQPQRWVGGAIRRHKPHFSFQSATKVSHQLPPSVFRVRGHRPKRNATLRNRAAEFRTWDLETRAILDSNQINSPEHCPAPKLEADLGFFPSGLAPSFLLLSVLLDYHTYTVFIFIFVHTDIQTVGTLTYLAD
jgi:hypothetical protein